MFHVFKCSPSKNPHPQVNFTPLLGGAAAFSFSTHRVFKASRMKYQIPVLILLYYIQYQSCLTRVWRASLADYWKYGGTGKPDQTAVFSTPAGISSKGFEIFPGSLDNDESVFLMVSWIHCSWLDLCLARPGQVRLLTDCFNPLLQSWLCFFFFFS